MYISFGYNTYIIKVQPLGEPKPKEIQKTSTVSISQVDPGALHFINTHTLYKIK